MDSVIHVINVNREGHLIKAKTESSIDKVFHMLHLDLFGLVNIMSISKKRYTLVIVDEYTRFTWGIISTQER